MVQIEQQKDSSKIEHQIINVARKGKVGGGGGRGFEWACYVVCAGGVTCIGCLTAASSVPVEIICLADLIPLEMVQVWVKNIH